jgi:hypothetical protein
LGVCVLGGVANAVLATHLAYISQQ